MSVECIGSVEALTTWADVRFDDSMGSLMTFEIMLSDEGGFAGRTRVRSVCQMGLDVRAQVVSSSKLLSTAGVETEELSVFTGSMDERLQLSRRKTGLSRLWLVRHLLLLDDLFGFSVLGNGDNRQPRDAKSVLVKRLSKRTLGRRVIMRALVVVPVVHFRRSEARLRRQVCQSVSIVIELRRVQERVLLKMRRVRVVELSSRRMR